LVSSVRAATRLTRSALFMGRENLLCGGQGSGAGKADRPGVERANGMGLAAASQQRSV